MSTRHISFKDLTLAEFEAYAKTLLDHTVSGANRERQIAYLRRIVANDDGLIKSEQVLLSARRRLQRLQRDAIDAIELDHSLDFEAAPELFVDAPKTDAEIIALLTLDNSTVYLRDRTLSGNIRITGNNVRLIGLGTTGTAVAGTLACTCTCITDMIQIGGDNVRLEGIKFQTSGDKAITFVSGKGTGLDLEQCIFESTHGTYSASKFYYGSGAGAGGNQMIKNCVIKDFGSWMLGDATTSSAFNGSIRLESFTIDACKIENCAGSFAVRGPATGKPNGTVSFTNNVVVYGAGGVHASFWNNFEASEGISKVICTGNEVTGMTKLNNGYRGFMQAWSKNPTPWTITFEKNKLDNYQAGLQIACGPAASLFYAPNTNDDAYKVVSEAGAFTNMDFGAVFTYPFNDASVTYGPVNSVAEASLPATTFADALGTFPVA